MKVTAENQLINDGYCKYLLNVKQGENSYSIELKNNKDDFVVFSMNAPFFDDENNAEERLRNGIKRAVNYCKDTNNNELTIDLTELGQEVYYVLNIIYEEGEKLNEDTALADLSVIVCLPEPEVEADDVDGLRQIVTGNIIEKQSYGNGEKLIETIMNSDHQSFGNYLLDILISKSVSNTEVYKSANIDASTFNRLLNGENLPSRNTVTVLADSLNLTGSKREEFYHVAGYTVDMPTKPFSEYLADIMREKNLKRPCEVYVPCNISKENYYKLIRGENVPTRKTLGALAIGLKMTIEATERLYASVGLYFNNYRVFKGGIDYGSIKHSEDGIYTSRNTTERINLIYDDLAIKFFIIKGFSTYYANCTLNLCGMPCLGNNDILREEKYGK